MSETVLRVAAALSIAGTALAQTGASEQIRDLDAQDPYRTPRAGEGFRVDVFGQQIEEPPRDRRSVSAWDVGLATTPRIEGLPVLPFASAYFWRNPDEDYLLRATVVGVFNDVYLAQSPKRWGPFEVIGTFQNFTVPVATTELVDGERIEPASLFWGTVRPGIGLGVRGQVGPAQDNMVELGAIFEPGLLYFASGDDTGASYETPDTTLELRGRLRFRLDNLERNLIELPHHGYALGADYVVGHRVDWSDWGDPAVSSVDASSAQTYSHFSGYALGAMGIGLGDRHRVVGSVTGGIGDDVDRFSALRVGGGPDPRGEEYDALARPILPGAAIGEFFPEHYVIGYAGYRFEAAFFAYFDVGAAYGWLDRDRLTAPNSFVREDDTFRAVSARLTSGFLGRTRIQLHYAYNFDVIRDGDEGGYEITFHVSGQF